MAGVEVPAADGAYCCCSWFCWCRTISQAPRAAAGILIRYPVCVCVRSYEIFSGRVGERDGAMEESPLIPKNIRVDGVSRWMNKVSQISPKTESTLKLPFPFRCTSYALKRDFSTVGRWRRLEGKGEMRWKFLHVSLFSFMSRYYSLLYSLRVWVFRRLTDSPAFHG